MEPPNNQNQNDEFSTSSKSNPQEFTLKHENLLSEEANYKWQPSQNGEPSISIRPFLVPEEHVSEPVYKKPETRKSSETEEAPKPPDYSARNTRRLWVLVSIAVFAIVIGVVVLLTVLAVQTKQTLVIINTTTAAVTTTTTTPQPKSTIIAPALGATTAIPAIASTASSLKQALAINCGGGADGSYVTDAFFTSSGVSYVVTNTINMSNVPFPAPISVYQSQRIGITNYIIPNLKPNSPYIIRLHFAELYLNSPGMRLFDVFINQSQVLYNFDLYNAAGGMFKAFVKEFPAQADTNGQLFIAFRRGAVEYPVINGIEVLSNLTPTPIPITATPFPVLPTSTPVATPFQPIPTPTTAN
ncbi:malectin domain-containing carbohydrate-binding protein [Candidatus Chlorohelix sp.]|uniref:malectin domain-containing carbohydrate-binding protein n=1 Tax=Candidatus Chlorohelix sp. TaxID=3139201 RepID=UPI003060D467